MSKRSLFHRGARTLSSTWTRSLAFLGDPFLSFPPPPTFILTNRSTHSNKTSSDFPRQQFANEWGCAVNGASTYQLEAPKTAPPGNQKAQEWQPGHPHPIFEGTTSQAMATLEPTRRERATFGSFCFVQVLKMWATSAGQGPKKCSKRVAVQGERRI